ncbi:transcription termination factor MTEF18, mitochondrial-like isoform X3 [Andrographis paniculata]|uniref:transcription termination factor MTEF18, mitochondrial-like isoform X3 n=1 Tax=Andrographis paniculata TaxID=175694 RepID=UPI0021E89426|nr:transcription termination factor MTEF18, mitochondrial-like isoform X3 [Andrographis paniculata]
MSNLRKFRSSNGLKWISVIFCPENNHKFYVDVSHPRRLYRTGTVNSSNCGNLCELAKKSRVRIEAQDALLDYFHGTRGLQIIDAENMSRNTPHFFDSLAKRVDIDEAQVKKSLTRFLRYHPINEFEPFFESIGLKPSEYLPFVPRNMMFLSDDELLLENYYALCNYGIQRDWIGKIYKEATEIFGYDYGVLSLKLQSIQNLGLNYTLVAKIIASTPRLLVENSGFVEFLAKLKTAGIQNDWLEEHISVEDSYDWTGMLKVMRQFNAMGLNEEKIKQTCTQHPQLLLECPKHTTLPLFGFFWKFGFTFADMQNLFLQFPEISVVKFTNNICCSLKFLRDINMCFEELGWFVRSHPVLLGSSDPKSVKSLQTSLNCGKAKLNQMLKDDPNLLQKWALGLRVDPVHEAKYRVLQATMLKTKFLLSLGYKENSKEMMEALKVLRGRGAALKDRFDCLMNSGLSHVEVASMFRLTPRILNQSKEILEMKVKFLVEELGIPVPELVGYPKILCYKIPRVKLRVLMYKWLKDEAAVPPDLALSTLLSSSDEMFMKTYVESHPRGPQIWKELKKEVESD